MVRIRWSSSLAAIVALAAATACAPGRVVEGVEPETSVEILREIQMTSEAFLPEDEGNLVDVVIEDDGLVFVYDGNLPNFQVDQVVSGVMHGGYLRRILTVGATSVDSDGYNRIQVGTRHAELGELIGDGHFILHFRPGTDTFIVTEDADIGGTGAPLTGGWSLLPAEFGAGVACNAAGSSSVNITPSLDMDVDIDVEIDIRWSLGRWLIPRGELHYAKFELTGGIAPGMVIESSSSTGVNCSWNLVDFARMRGLSVPKREWVTTFPVGPVPVAITHTIQPEFSITASGSIETGASTLTASADLGFTAGAEFTPGRGWQPIWRPRREGSISLDVAEPGTLSVSIGASGGIGYLGKIYDSAGPGISLGPSATATFRVHPDRCEWDGDVTAGITLTGRAVLEIPVIDYRLAEYAISQELVSAEVAQGMGTFPWPQCDEEPMPADPPGPGILTPPDGPILPGGPGSGGPGGDTSGDGVLDPPSPFSDPDPSPELDEAPPLIPPEPPAPDACSDLGACDDCNVRAGCGWCDSTGSCMEDASQGACPGGTAAWRDGLAECRDCSGYGDCEACLMDSFCGWCGGGGCQTAEVGGAAPSTCSGSWDYFMCGG